MDIILPDATSRTGHLIRVYGLVQGVGFRPTVWRIATDMALAGHVRNDAAGVEIALWCSAGELAGKAALDGSHPDQTVGNYWPYATTIFDFVRRSMPLNAPRRLTNDQVYAVTAYLLAINGVIGDSDSMDATTLPAVEMPNREGFVRVWPTGR